MERFAQIRRDWIARLSPGWQRARQVAQNLITRVRPYWRRPTPWLALSRRAKIVRVGVGTLVTLLLLAWLIPLPERLLQPGSTVVYFKEGIPAYVFLSPDEKWRIRVALSDIDLDYLEALVAIEDKRFWYHPGVDPIAIVRAAIENLAAGHVVAGGSTITMQLVRVLEPRPRTLPSKIVEALRAVQLELKYSKREILEAYLQFVPFGRNIEGVEAASLSYFGHRASALSPAEITTLLAVPQNPNRRYPTPGHADRLQQARDELAQKLYGPLPNAADTLAQITRTRVPQQLHAFPRHAIHASFWLTQQYPDTEKIHTTLDRGLQFFLQRTFTAARVRANQNGIYNGAGVLVDHQQASVRALVGNYDFWDEKHGGQIVGFDVARSPGSLMKPFIYALAIDQGKVLPDYLVADIPARYGSYAPENYDGQFRGLVRLEDALSWSLNLPFVNLLKRIRVEEFLSKLRDMGVYSMESRPGHYGLSAAVGGLELTPIEIASVYSTLARNGNYQPLAILQSDKTKEMDGSLTTEVLTPGSSYLTRKALAIRDRPDFPSRRDHARTPPHIHWKTGTSFGNRDAWAAGSGPRYTAVVWQGNFDNSPSSELVGSEAAGPLLFDVLEGVRNAKGVPFINTPSADLTTVKVCSYSGRLPTASCQHTKEVQALKTNVPTEYCPFHIHREIDLASGRSVTPTCRQGRSVETRYYKVWPASIRRWLKDQYRRVPQPPSLAEGCEGSTQVAAPSIVSPPKNAEIILLAGMAANQQELAMEAESKITTGKLSWFVNGEFIGSAKPDARLWWVPRAGRHEILVMDKNGQIDRRTIQVHARKERNLADLK